MQECFNQSSTKRQHPTFWLFFLRELNGYFTPALRNIILTILSTPIANAEVERGFSMINYAKRFGPSNGVAAFNAPLFIKLNGPDDEFFIAFPQLNTELRTGTVQLMTPRGFEVRAKLKLIVILRMMLQREVTLVTVIVLFLQQVLGYMMET